MDRILLPQQSIAQSTRKTQPPIIEDLKLMGALLLELSSAYPGHDTKRAEERLDLATAWLKARAKSGCYDWQARP